MKLISKTVSMDDATYEPIIRLVIDVPVSLIDDLELYGVALPEVTDDLIKTIGSTFVSYLEAGRGG